MSDQRHKIDWIQWILFFEQQHQWNDLYTYWNRFEKNLNAEYGQVTGNRLVNKYYIVNHSTKDTTKKSQNSETKK